ncbi:reverse transcriptase domain-containing protein [Tanacetum coccineum]|uniref:Reverse transcriptase domain-containing protein n=1 Tax=Tanacetum coccineum TaxID=301880 RepID=A0ABQ4YM21_9ASTR
MSPWPFYKWGIDIAGPFPEGPGKVKFLIVAMDYFTKWIEAKPVATITDNPFKDWCEKLCIRQRFASVKHPQANGLVERSNRSLGERIKARLEERSKDWIEEIPHVLWAHRTMIKSSNGDTLTTEIDMVQNDEALEINLDLLEERREQAAIREARSKAKMEKYYNSKVRNTSFKREDLVYRNNDVSHAKDSGKHSFK